MKIGLETGTAVVLLTELGLHDGGCTSREISRLTGIQPRLCDKSLRELRDKGLVESTAAGSEQKKILYMTTERSQALTLNDFCAMFDDKLKNGLCLFCRKGCDGSRGECCAFGAELKRLSQDIENQMSKVTIRKLVDSKRGAWEQQA